ncbi:MAG TPA: hypothetical protein VIE41_03920 [Methylomirabilota bacterium]|jgi:hypothetical protein
MRRLSWTLRWRASGVTGLLAVLGLVSLPIELTVGLVEQPVIAPAPVVSLLLIGSCLLLVGGGLGLRRLEAARVAAQPPSPDA